MLDIRVHTGPEIATLRDGVAQLRIKVFREFPYLYDGSMTYERNYLDPFLQDPTAVVVAAYDGKTLVGASTASALSRHQGDFAAAFNDSALPLEDVYYLAESVLLPAWRGQGIGHVFFDHREAAARHHGFHHAAFCAVVRSPDHPARPVAYRPHDAFWSKRGYSPLPGVIAHFDWTDLGAAAPTTKDLQFWARKL